MSKAGEYGQMIIQRARYLDRLAKLEGNGLVKIVTGIRRCGKSFPRKSTSS